MNWSSEWNQKASENATGDYLEQSITFKDGHKARTNDVIIVGDLGLDFDDSGWNIYHIPTLSCFSKAVPATYPATMEFIDGQESYDYSRDDLLAWMKKVQENYPTAWTMLRLLTPENYADKGESAKEIIQKWCLSVKVEGD